MPRADTLCDESNFFQWQQKRYGFLRNELKLCTIYKPFFGHSNHVLGPWLTIWIVTLLKIHINKTMIMVPSSQEAPFHCGVHMQSNAPAVLLHVPAFKHGEDVVHSSTSDKQHIFIFVMPFVYLHVMEACIRYINNELGTQCWIITTHLFSIERADWLNLHDMFNARDAKSWQR